jgi:hypothetical protein
VKFFNPFVTQGKGVVYFLMGYALKCTLYPNICNKTPENYTQIYAVRKLEKYSGANLFENTFREKK